MRVLAILALVLISPALSLAPGAGPALARQTQPAQPAQQPPAAQPQQEAQQQTLEFSSGAGIIYNVIKPDKTADFEKFVAKLHEAISKSQDEKRKQQAAGWKVYRVKEPVGQNVMYMFFIDPAVAGADYTAIRIISESLPSDAHAAYEMIKDAFAGRSLANLDLVADFSKPPAGAAQP
ncbi:MAG TPA: hypothetical protein VNI83_15625 [Vicinamibacterales bacterium]|nr:hypothetical protein [Vicinamibacterales bacterium]